MRKFPVRDYIWMVFSPKFALFGETIAAECHDVADQRIRDVLGLFRGKREDGSHGAKKKASDYCAAAIKTMHRSLTN
jgi:hypothetical protein